MSYYPIFLELKERHCLVIGGGSVAERRVEGLLAAEAVVTVISPTLTVRLGDWRSQGLIRYIACGYQPGDLAGYDLVFAATDNDATHAAAFREACSGQIWINAADAPHFCDFILPASVRRGDLTVAISTGGASPAVARVIREELETHFTAEYAQLVQIAGEVRNQLRAESRRATPEAWNQALKGTLRRLIEERRPEKAKEALLAALGGVP